MPDTLPDMGDLESPRDQRFSDGRASPGWVQEAPEKPDLSGRWRLNPRASDDAGKVVREALKEDITKKNPLRNAARQVVGKRHYGLREQLARFLVQFLEVPESLQILHQDTVLTMADEKERLRTLYIDETPNTAFGKGIVAVTRWSGMQLITDVDLRKQGVARLTLALAPGGFQLHLTLQIHHARFSHPILVHSVYDFVAESLGIPTSRIFYQPG